MARFTAPLAAAACAALFAAHPALAQDKPGTSHAFLVACSEYRQGQFRKLPYAVKETEEFRQVLLKTGFDANNVLFLNDTRTEEAGRFLPLKDHILEELDLLRSRVTAADMLVVVLNGHGLHFQ